jgi:hypothetical protein
MGLDGCGAEVSDPGARGGNDDPVAMDAAVVEPTPKKLMTPPHEAWWVRGFVTTYSRRPRRLIRRVKQGGDTTGA